MGMVPDIGVLSSKHIGGSNWILLWILPSEINTTLKHKHLYLSKSLSIQCIMYICVPTSHYDHFICCFVLLCIELNNSATNKSKHIEMFSAPE